MWLALVVSAHASCRMAQFATPDGAQVVIEAVSEPLSCRRVTLIAPGGLALVSAKMDGKKLKKDHIRAEASRVELSFAELRPGGKTEVGVRVSGEGLRVILGDVPAEPAVATETHTTWSVALDLKHPGWGFADSKLSTTSITELTIGPDGRHETIVPGAKPQGELWIPPGSFTLLVPGARLVGAGSDGVEITVLEGGMRWDAPQGGTVRWRVSTVAGDVVIPDGRTYLAGLDWRWGQVSLPEPAPPSGFRAGKTQRESAEALFLAVREMNTAALPGADPLHPRMLNRAWKSGFGSSVEQSLILDRLVRQQSIASTWVLTGTAPEPMTLTGYDRMFALVHLDDHDVPLDPACAVCAFGELSTEVAGHAALGGLEFAPLQPGSYTRSIALVGTEYHVSVRLDGAAALWLREKLYGASGVAVTDRVGEATGVLGGTVAKLEGVEVPGAPIAIEMTTSGSVKPPFSSEPPWVGGWSDL